MKKMLLFLILSFLGLCMCSCGKNDRSINLENSKPQEGKTDELEEDEPTYEVDAFAEDEEMAEYTDMNAEYV